jgi:hypothetical protein
MVMEELDGLLVARTPAVEQLVCLPLVFLEWRSKG